MASLDHRLNPLFSIKECMSCGALYTKNCGCSKGSLEDKILVPVPDSSQQQPQNCATCGGPVDGLYCRPCAFVRKCLNKGWYTIHEENKILNTYSAPQEPFVFNQDLGENSSQNPPHINHNCYECGEQCTCKSCGKGAHYGYNCPPQIPFISNPEPCYNQNLNEILQNLQSLQQQNLSEESFKKKDMSIEEIMSEMRLIDDEINDITNDLSYKRFRGEKIDDEYERDCEIKINQLLQDYNGLNIEMRKKERVLMEEKYLAASQRIYRLENDEDDSIPFRDILIR
ncbi:hypothetical protein Tco_0638428 [Tanacetum coccineum]